MAQGDNLGAKFSLDITNLKAGLSDANKLIRQSESEFIEAAAGLNDWSKSSDGLSKRVSTLNDQIEIQKSKMQSLIAVRNETIAKMKEEGAADEDIAAVADRVNVQLQKEQKQLETLQGRADKATKELNDFNNSENAAGKSADTLSKETEKAGKSAKKAGDGFTVFKGVLSDLAASAVKGLGKSIVAGLSGIGKTVKNTVSGIIKSGDEIAKNSEKAGFKSKAAYQEWSFVLQHTGTDISALTKGLNAISTANDKATKSIKSLGVEMTDASGNARASEDIFNDVVSKLSQMTDETKKSQIAQSIFGKNFGELRPLLNDGADSVENLKKRAHELGVVLSDETLKESENMADSLTDFQSSIDGLKNKVVSGFLPSMRGVVDGLTDIFSGSNVDGGLNKISDSVGDISKKILDNAPSFLKTAGTIINALLSALADSMPKISATLGQLINDGLPILTKLLVSAAPVVSGAIGQMIGALARELPSIISGLFGALKNAILQIVEWLNSGDNLKNFVDGLVKLTADIVSQIGQLLPVIIPAIAQIITGVITALTTPENTELLLQAVLVLLKGVFDALVNLVPVLIDFVKNIISNLAGLFADFLGVAVPFVAGVLEKIVETVKGWISSIISFVSGLFSKIKESVIAFISGVKQFFVDGFNNIRDGIAGIIEKIGGFVGDLIAKVKEIPSKIVSIGSDIVRGLWEGISNMAKWIGEKIKGFGKGVLDGLKSFFKIKSPSQVMRDVIGKNLALGIGAGFDAEMSTVARDMQSSLNGAIPSLSVPAVGGVADSAGQTGAGSGVVVYQTNNYSQQHSRFEIYQSKQATAAAVRAALAGG